MTIHDFVLLFTAGVCMYAGVLHLMVGFRSEPKNHVHIVMGVLGLLVGAYCIDIFAIISLLGTQSKRLYVSVDKIGIALNYFFYACQFFFVALYTKMQSRTAVWIPVAVYGSIGLIDLLIPFPGTWVYTDIQLSAVSDPIIELAPWYKVEGPLTFFLFAVYAAWGIVNQYRRGERREALALALGAGVFSAGYAWDIFLVEYGLVPLILLQQYGGLAFIVIMSYRLAGLVVTSERQARRLNLNLEKVVAERTIELTEANQALTLAREKAEAANLAKSTFLANMSHELRSPLNAILGNAQIMVRDDGLASEHRHSIDAINRSSNHLLSLINHVLEMAKVEAGHAGLNPSPFDVDVLIDDLRLMFEDRIRDKGLAFEIVKGADNLKCFVGDRGKISQILINLLSNAIQYTREGGIVLRVWGEDAEAASARLIFEVRDSGSGISADDRERIFEPFVQGRSVTDQKTGTGLGLAISLQYAKLMNGDLAVESQVDRGTTFRLQIPMKVAPSGQMAQADIAPSHLAAIRGAFNDVRVLVVDDEAANRDVLVRLIEPAGFQIKAAVDGPSAIDLSASWSPHLILMDIRMPGMSGIEAIQRIKGSPATRAIPIIGLSASAFEEDRRQVLDGGAEAFVAKPIHESDLWQHIGRLLNIDWEFKKGSVDRPCDGTSSPVLVGRETLAQLPDPLHQAMREAVRGGYIERFARLAAQASDLQPELSRYLMDLADRYDIQTLTRLLLGNEGGRGENGN